MRPAQCWHIKRQWRTSPHTHTRTHTHKHRETPTAPFQALTAVFFALFPLFPSVHKLSTVKFNHLQKSNWCSAHIHGYTNNHSHKTHTHRLLDIEGASRHSVVPVSQLVVLRANHHPSGGLVHSAITGREERKRKKHQKRQRKDGFRKSKVVALQSAMRHTLSHATREAWWYNKGCCHKTEADDTNRERFDAVEMGSFAVIISTENDRNQYRERERVNCEDYPENSLLLCQKSPSFWGQNAAHESRPVWIEMMN